MRSDSVAALALDDRRLKPGMAADKRLKDSLFDSVNIGGKSSGDGDKSYVSGGSELTSQFPCSRTLENLSSDG